MPELKKFKISGISCSARALVPDRPLSTLKQTLCHKLRVSAEVISKTMLRLFQNNRKLNNLFGEGVLVVEVFLLTQSIWAPHKVHQYHYWKPLSRPVHLKIRKLKLG
jgi:hypothetical protein